MELLKILNDFEEIIEENPRIPMTGKIIIAEETILNFIDRIRTSLPETVKQADWVAKERERILEEAKQEGEKIVQDAHHYVVKVADESEVVKQAQMQAEDIVAKANEVAKEIHFGANEYADEILKQLQAQMEAMIKSIEEGRIELEKSMKK